MSFRELRGFAGNLPVVFTAVICWSVFFAGPAMAVKDKLGEDGLVDMSGITQVMRIQPHKEDLPVMIKRKTIRVLTSFSKTFFFIHKGRPIGFEFDMLNEYDKWLNKKNKLNIKNQVHLEFIPVPSDKIIPFLLEGRGDIAAAGLTVTNARAKKVAFTSPYITGVDEVLVCNKSAKGINKVEDLSGKTVGVRASSSYFRSLEKLNHDFEKKGLEPVKILELADFLATEDILEMVNAGILSMTVTDDHIARLWSNVFTDLDIHENIMLRKDGRIAWMVRKDNPELLDSLNQFIKGHKKGTLLGNIYFNRFFKDTKWITNPISEEEMKRLEHYQGLFKKYGEMYNIDWLLIAAQAFQESGIDQSKRSRAGAIGIMQIMPALKKDKRLNIQNFNLNDAEDNIHAGVKYMALIRKLYFQNEGISSVDKYRFALAAYNAGPSRISRSRGVSKQMGYNEDIWFKNSEIGALKLAGREPVTYVSNINKYYLAYRLAMDLYKTRNQLMEEMKKDSKK